MPFASYILAVADTVERLIERDVPILTQSKHIRDTIEQEGLERFSPRCWEAFCDASSAESFWLDCVSPRLHELLLDTVEFPMVQIDEDTIQPIAELFGLIADAAISWTATHSAGVARSAEALAEGCGFSPRELKLMRAAGHLHDIGKLAIPVQILDKPGQLTREERAVIKEHTYHTFHILRSMHMTPQVCEWAAFHHERLDGRGYPFHHTGEQLTLGARIMAVADIFTALAEDRPYRLAFSREKILGCLDELVKNRGLDEHVVAVLADNYHEVDDLRRVVQETHRWQHERIQDIIEPRAAA